MKLYDDFIDFIRLLKKYRIKYLLVGGYAVSVHSRPKSTQDIDFWIKPDNENAEKILKVISEFGFSDLNLEKNDLIKSNQIIQFGYAPIRIDLMTSISGVNFEEAYNNKTKYKMPEIGLVDVISIDDLIKNKKEIGRSKDIEDLKWIEKYKK